MTEQTRDRGRPNAKPTGVRPICREASANLLIRSSPQPFHPSVGHGGHPVNSKKRVASQVSKCKGVPLRLYAREATAKPERARVSLLRKWAPVSSV